MLYDKICIILKFIYLILLPYWFLLDYFYWLIWRKKPPFSPITELLSIWYYFSKFCIGYQLLMELFFRRCSLNMWLFLAANKEKTCSETTDILVCCVLIRAIISFNYYIRNTLAIKFWVSSKEIIFSHLVLLVIILIVGTP